MTTTLVMCATTVLGITLGAIVAEAALLVPYWKSLPPDAFLRWYRENADRLLRFFGPLEVAATLLTVVAAVSHRLSTGGFSLLLVSSSVALVVALAMFPAYFKRANASFAAGTIAPDLVAAELHRWERWHWVRIAVVATAFLATLSAVGGDV